MWLLENHPDVHISVLLLEQLDQASVFLIEITFDLKNSPVAKNEVRGVAPWNHEVVLALLVLPVHPVVREVISDLAFKARAKPVRLAFAVLVESLGHYIRSRDLRT